MYKKFCGPFLSRFPFFRPINSVPLYNETQLVPIHHHDSNFLIIICSHIAWQISDMLTLQVNLGVYIADEKYELSVLVDRAVGASSIQDSQLEIMLHRY